MVGLDRELPTIPVWSPGPLPNNYTGPEGKPSRFAEEAVPYFGPENPGPYFVPVSELLRYQAKWSVSQLRELLEGKEVCGWDDMVPVDVEFVEFRVSKVTDVKVFQVGHSIDISEKGVHSLELLAKLGLFAARRGATIVELTAQGALRKAKMRGWSSGGIVGGTTMSGEFGMAGSGAFGPNAGMSWGVDFPWLRGIPLKVED